MSIMTTDLWRMSATELAEAIRSRHISSQEVIEAHLRRIEAMNPSINAVTVVLGEQALEAAKAADRTVAAGGDLPQFHGVPFTVKGNIDVAGTPTTQGLVEQLAALQATFCPMEQGAMLQAALVTVRFYQKLAPPLAQAHGIPYPAELARVMSERLEQLGHAGLS